MLRMDISSSRKTDLEKLLDALARDTVFQTVRARLMPAPAVCERCAAAVQRGEIAQCNCVLATPKVT